MLQLTYLEQRYSLDLLQGHMYGNISLDHNWRELNYKNGDSSLDIGMSLFFSTNSNQVSDLATKISGD